ERRSPAVEVAEEDVRSLPVEPLAERGELAGGAPPGVRGGGRPHAQGVFRPPDPGGGRLSGHPLPTRRGGEPDPPPPGAGGGGGGERRARPKRPRRALATRSPGSSWRRLGGRSSSVKTRGRPPPVRPGPQLLGGGSRSSGCSTRTPARSTSTAV